MSLDSDFTYYFHGDSLLQRREIELLDAKLTLKRYEALAQSAPKSHKARFEAEVYRFRARIESLELSIRLLKEQ